MTNVSEREVGPLVTVCVPTVGRPDYLPIMLQSLASQTYRECEILILDNASPRLGQQIIEDFARRDARVRIIRTEERLPLFSNWNRGVRASAAQYLSFFHDDDIYYPDFIERQLRALVESPAAGFVGSNCHVIDDNGQIVGERQLIRSTGLIPGHRFIGDLLRRGRGVMSTPGIMYRREALAASGFDETTSIHYGDFVSLMRIAETWDVAVVNETLWQNRKHSRSGTLSIPISQAMSLRSQVFKDYAEGYLTRWPYDPGDVRTIRWELSASFRLGLLWAWLMASDAEGEGCYIQLRDAGIPRWMVEVLRETERRGLRATQGRRLIAPLIERVARRVPV